MEKKINIAELLKDCPQGMELYSPIFGEVYLDKIRPHLSIVVATDKEQGDFKEEFLYDGRYGMNGECMLFPSKGKTTWEGFIPPCKFNDGDIIADNHKNIAIYKGKIWYNRNLADFYCGYRNSDNRFLDNPKKDGHFGSIEELHLATEEEKQKLFDVIKENGYKWNAETKTLDKLSKFKAGDVLVSENGNIVLLSHIDSENVVNYHCIIPTYGSFRIEENTSIGVGRYYECVLANEQQRQRMYDKIKCSGYKYNQSTNKLEKLTEPKFNVGDRIEFKYHERSPELVVKVKDNGYILSSGRTLMFQDENAWELCTGKFDITTLKPFESRVLVRDSNYGIWRVSFWGCLINTENGFNYDTIRGCYKQRVPYEQNEHLLGKTDDCDEYYKSWE
jgi:hypothetical protein